MMMIIIIMSGFAAPFKHIGAVHF
jgi:hypothetical protein